MIQFSSNKEENFWYILQNEDPRARYEARVDGERYSNKNLYSEIYYVFVLLAPDAQEVWFSGTKSIQFINHKLRLNEDII